MGAARSARGGVKLAGKVAKAAATRRPYSPRRPRAERREQVLDAALAIVDEEGFGGLTIEAVARRADLAKTVIYDSVGNHEKLLRALVRREQERAMRDVAAAMPALPFGGPEDLLGNGLTALLSSVRQHPATWRLILLPPEGAPPLLREDVDRSREQLREQLEPIVKWGLKTLGAADIDAELATLALLATVENAIRITLSDPDRFPAERLAEFGRALVRRVA